MCVIERGAIFKEILSIAASVSEFLSSAISCCEEALQENICDEPFFKKISNLENFLVNN